MAGQFNRIIAVSTLLLTACASDDDEVIVVTSVDSVNADVEGLATGSFTGFANLSRHRVVASGNDAIVELELVDDPDVLGELPGAEVRDATSWKSSQLLILTSDGLWVYDGELRPSPLEDAMSVPDIEALAASGDALWLRTSDETRIWYDGWLNSVEIDGQRLTGPFAVGGAIDGIPVVWTSNGDGVYAMQSDGSFALAESRSIGKPSTMGVDSTGALWAAAGGSLYRRDPAGAWQRFDVSDTVTEVYANVRSPVIWVRGETSVLSGRVSSAEDYQFVRAEGVPDGTTWRVDDVGRLLMHTDQGIMQVSVGRPVAILGIPDDGLIFTPTELSIVPVEADAVVDINASLNGMDVAVRSDPWRLTVDPVGLTAGEYDLQISVEYQGQSAATSRPVVVANPTWQDDIFPLYQERCSLCHVDGSGTVGLETPEAWEIRFDDLLGRVERNNMPLGQEPLSDFQKTLIRAWGEKGFPR